eukprot:CAMPEP_0177252694 /NCGR_PEP_ID=MMETSP0367-20130122/54697_1 /TAXON_ID=447022 ORGANISM="Scrippsiella hangoei-like, Strain SHHI-4" /NCGR_SAMPLE_ID=MMETSP0367 /ASSEMBLY_ACC=CAM_ASM_000362 /LENGTH=73 /DNA_ID=CAMNT_0018705833 /DNA_START=16 /DNA_END=233 /DNA_ORIENTATION=-
MVSSLRQLQALFVEDFISASAALLAEAKVQPLVGQGFGAQMPSGKSDFVPNTSLEYLEVLAKALVLLLFAPYP